MKTRLITCRSRRKEAVLSVLATACFLYPTLAATFTVSMVNTRFDPNNLTVNVGDTVRWVNQQGFHDTVSGSSGVPSGAWNSNSQFGHLMQPGDTFSVTFSNPGTFPYYCTPHWRLGMTGTIQVNAPNSPPAISILSPANGANFSAPADISVLADASDPGGAVTQVQFFMNGTPIGADLDAPYTATANNLGPGNYTISATATDNSGATASASVSVTVSGQQPTITNPPQSQTANAGSDVRFTVQAVGSAPLDYQWFFGPSPIAGANTTSLLLTNVSSVDAGTYTVQVANSFGSASASATLVVTNPPVGTPPAITTHPESQTVNEGTNVTFTAAAIGSTPLIWQWFHGGSPIAGATTASLVLSNVTIIDGGIYFALVTNDFGSAVSSNAVLAVSVLPTCEYTLSKNNSSFSASGGPDSLAVSTAPGCTWTVSNTNSWIAVVSGTNGVGPGPVTFLVLSNSVRTPRSATFLIAGNTFTVMQAAPVFDTRNDFNHDGQADFLWQYGDGRLRLWLMNGLTRFTSLPLLKRATRGWEVVATHDFDRDRNEDILFQHTTGPISLWFMNGTNFIRSQPIGHPGSLWRVAGVADFNQDRQADLLLRHRDGYLLAWFMNGPTFVSQLLLFNGEPVPPAWRIAGVVDINHDGQPDILWQNQSRTRTTSLVVWFMNGTLPLSGPLLSNLPRPNALIVGLNDLNQDGSIDFIWRNPKGQLAVWLMDGTNHLDSASINKAEPLSTAWKFVAPKK
jgi:plastocyanin